MPLGLLILGQIFFFKQKVHVLNKEFVFVLLFLSFLERNIIILLLMGNSQLVSDPVSCLMVVGNDSPETLNSGFRL